MHRAFLTVIFLMVWMGVSGASFAAQSLPRGGTTELSIAVAGATRTYLAHVPASAVHGAAPLVIVLHGAGGNGAKALEQGHWVRAAERHGFIVMAPDGSLQYPRRRPSLISNPRTWNSGPETGSWASQAGIDDVAFIKALIEFWVREGRVDPRRVYVTGFSNGAAMAFRTGAELSERIAAIAPVANALLLPVSQLARPVSLLLIWGEDDPLNPINGGEVTRGGVRVTRPGGNESWSLWGQLLRCTVQERAKPKRGLTIQTQADCAEGAEAVLYRIDGLGHQWPGGKTYVSLVSGPNSNAIDATNLIWAFFQKHARVR
jgi:polyhydroxybutyrate depolymerase